MLNAIAALVRVALAALGGPTAVMTTALQEAVSGAESAAERLQSRERQWVDDVAGPLRSWAAAEKFSDEDITLGLETAQRLIAARDQGFLTLVVEHHFDPDAVSDHILGEALDADRRWRTEPHHAVADRALRETYRVLTRSARTDPETIAEVVIALHQRAATDAGTTRARLDRIGGEIDALRRRLLDGADAADLRDYLTTRLRDWDHSLWGPRPALIDAPLHLRHGERHRPERDVLGAEEKLAVLGGPGSGKSTLARRHARQVAERAVSALDRDVALSEIEVPLFTTWRHWLRATGSVRESLVEASFAAGLGHGDLGDDGIVQRLTRTFLGPERVRIVAIVDSFDEAQEEAPERLGARVRELASLRGWRVLTTSRVGVWPARDWPRETRATAVVEDLTTADVERIVTTWFAEDPDRGAQLLAGLADDGPLHELVRVPLLLAFTCVLAEDAPADGLVLPTRRRHLLDALASRLLEGVWTDRHLSQADAAVAGGLAALTQMAHRCIGAPGSPHGMRTLLDEVPASTQVVPSSLQRMLDAVAPRRHDHLGGGARRFVHRMLLEHFVARSIAQLPTDEAADLLLPHLSLAPAWDGIVVQAVLLHHDRVPGHLLSTLLRRAWPTARNPVATVVREDLDGLMLRLAEESSPEEWPSDLRREIHACRARRATQRRESVQRKESVLRSAHWVESNAYVGRALIREALDLGLPSFRSRQRRRSRDEHGLPEALHDVVDASPFRAAELAWDLSHLPDPGIDVDAIRSTFLRAFRHELDQADAWGADEWVACLSSLEPDGEWQDVVRRHRRDAARWGDNEAFLEWSVLGPALTPDEERQVRGVLLASLARHETPDPAHWWLLTACSPSEQEWCEAARHLTAMMPDHLGLATELAQAATRSGSASVIAEACSTLLDALPHAPAPTLPELLTALAGLSPTPAQSQHARHVATPAVPECVREYRVVWLTEAFRALGAGPDECADWALNLSQCLTDAASDSTAVWQCLEAMRVIGVSGDTAVRAVMAILPGHDVWGLTTIVSELARWPLPDGARDDLQAVLLRALSEAPAARLDGLVAALEGLGRLGPEAVRQARTAVAAALGTWLPDELGGTLLRLAPTEDAEALRPLFLAALRAMPARQAPRQLVTCLRLVSTQAQWQAHLREY